MLRDKTPDLLVVCAVFAVILAVAATATATATVVVATTSSQPRDDDPAAVSAAASTAMPRFTKRRFDNDDDNNKSSPSPSPTPTPTPTPTPPPLRPGSAGIVMCAGGPTYTPLANAAILSLRRTGCTLPVVVFYAGDDEMGRVERQILENTPGVVSIVDAAAAAGRSVKDVRGYQLKAVAVELSPFEHTVLLDADTLFFQDISNVLSSGAYLDTGAVFWPDMVPWNNGCIKRRAWRLRNIAPVKTERQQESSCVVVNKATSAVPLAYTYDMNQTTSCGTSTCMATRTRGGSAFWRRAALTPWCPNHPARLASTAGRFCSTISRGGRFTRKTTRRPCRTTSSP